jgi:hypothetical protein
MEQVCSRLPFRGLGTLRTMQSPHDGDGELHLAFAIPADELANWERGSKREELQWKKSGSGNWEAGASTFETPTVI